MPDPADAAAALDARLPRPPVQPGGPDRHRWLLFLALIGASIALGAGVIGRSPAARAQDAPRPAPRQRGDDVPDLTRTDYGVDCLSSGCHSALRKTPWVHAPVSVGACDTCHVLEGTPEEHRFSDAPPEQGTCLHCHQIDPKLAGAHVAFTETDCVVCHDPHGATMSTLLRHPDPSTLCASCHPVLAPDASGLAASEARHPLPEPPHAHTPFGEGRCVDCHTAHHSEAAHLLKVDETRLCRSCHEPVWEAVAQQAFVHEPVLENCRNCHGAHGGENARLLNAQTFDLCTGCHEDVRTSLATEGVHAHSAVTDGESCLTCHLGHGGPTETLVRSPESDACFSCHSEVVTTDDGRTIADIAAQLEGRSVLHGPIADGECSGCHQPHGSEHDHLLTAEVESRFYVPWAEDAYAFCFSCHDPRIVTDPNSTRTGFRDGDRNLHTLHVKRDKGRSCGVCHEVHASHGAALVKDSVPYGPGGWELPIDFRDTEEGGTCFAGCHQEASYDARVPAGDPAGHLLEPAAPADPEGGGNR